MKPYLVLRDRRLRWGSLIFLGALVLVACLSVWGRLTGRTRSAAAQVRKALAEQRPADAEAPLAQWLRAQPESAEAHFHKARIELHHGRSPRASEELDRSLALGYSEREVERWRAFLLVLAGRYVEAEPGLKRLAATAKGPDPEVDEALARVYLQTYRLSAAAKTLDLWIRDAPRDPTPYLWYVEIDQRTSADPSLIIDHYRKALARKPDLPKAQLGLAEALRLAHRNDEAEVVYQRYLAIQPSDPAGYIGAGLNADALGRPDEARRHLDWALELAPNDASALKERAAIVSRLGQFETALEDLDRAAKLHPYDGEVLYRRSLALSRLGRTEEAQAAQQAANRLREDTARLNVLRDRLNADPTNDDLCVEVARWLLDHGQDEEGLRWTKTVLARHPGHGPTNRLLVEYYQRNGDPGRANYYRLQAEAASSSSREKRDTGTGRH
jgi:tetratricopeptide (TPR) repeat protein